MTDRRKKLTEQQVAEIHAARAAGRTYGQIAIHFNVDRAVIWRVINGFSYKSSTENRQHLPETLDSA